MHYQRARKAGSLSATELCTMEECHAKLNSHNRSGLCRAHAKPQIMAANYKRNRDKRLAQAKEYYEANREAHNERSRAYYQRTKDVRLDWQHAYHDRNPQVMQRNRWTRKARLRDAFVEVVDPAVVWKRDGGICHICQLPADPADWHLEHVIPLARGGEHSYANTAVSHPACNMRKGVKVS